MAVIPLADKKIVIEKTNFPSKKILRDYSKDKKEMQLTSVYEEPYVNKTGNIDINELATAITAKMLGGVVKIPGKKVIDVDIKREIAIGKLDKNAVKSEVINGTVNNKVDKLRSLRR